MSETKIEFSSLRVYETTKLLLQDERENIRRSSGRVLTYDELVSLAINSLRDARGVQSDHYPYAPSTRTLHDKLEAILNSQDAEAIEAAMIDIALFFDRLKPGPGRE